jgi:hypothetical protein
LRSSSVKKLPEPLRRAVADCLSSPLASATEPSRILRVLCFFFFFAFDLFSVLLVEIEIHIIV